MGATKFRLWPASALRMSGLTGRRLGTAHYLGCPSFSKSSGRRCFLAVASKEQMKRHILRFKLQRFVRRLIPY
ncbi:hypothetical protein C7T35_33210 [Variovorax sp. WS11]|nr:hypothetical protein C7T35_33210 [Variovorax sp. WS11]